MGGHLLIFLRDEIEKKNAKKKKDLKQTKYN
jgi:hypothetical protein